MHVVFVAALSQLVEPKIPSLERRLEGGFICRVRGEVGEPQPIDLVSKELQAVGAIQIKRGIALGPEYLWDDRGEAHDDQVSQGDRVNPYG